MQGDCSLFETEFSMFSCCIVKDLDRSLVVGTVCGDIGFVLFNVMGTLGVLSGIPFTPSVLTILFISVFTLNFKL